MQQPDVAVMFSGGRDSSLAVVRYCMTQTRVRLLRFSTGLGIPSELPAIREAELRAAFPEMIHEQTPVLSAYGIVRRLALADIEEDFRRFAGKNLVLLGEKLALHCAATVHCLRNSVTVLADGTTGYQADLPEQRHVAIKFFHDLAQHFGITYETPVLDCTSSQEVRFGLLEAGLSTKSLEGISMFADTFSYAADETVADYLAAKRQTAVEYIERHIPTSRTGRLPQQPHGSLEQDCERA
ncbi:hypothetical protein [Streptomyces sp. 142MFCol3.1]|uniref:hypothetical protein n=1 Tax=Streptomyces sp. 142MFCol3.1 TaxID=1172179 RepID=UPI00068547CC|nr:hypothetical protein [Streptomyces sp. 142MFCol3.1]